MGTLASRNSPRISLTRNITSAHTLEELKTQISEFVSKLEDYLNSQIGIHFLQDNTRRPTLIAGDLVFDFINHPQFATLQQWDGEKLIPLDLSAISGYIDLVAQGIGSGTDSSLFLRSDGAGHWVLAAGPVGPAGPSRCSRCNRRNRSEQVQLVQRVRLELMVLFGIMEQVRLLVV
jgi:hypothetical protein